MKKTIKANKQSKDYYIDIDCYFEIPVYVKSAKEAEWADEEEIFHELIIRIGNRLNAQGFKMVQDTPSSRSWDSHYFSFYVVDKNGKMRSEYLIHLRISKHITKSKTDAEYLAHGNRYYERLGREFQMGDKPPVALFRSIIIGQSEFADEYEALKYIDRITEQLSEPEADLKGIIENFKNGEEV